MRKILASVLLTASCLMAVSLNTAATTSKWTAELIQNGGFENDLEGWFFSSESVKADFAVTEAQRYSGQKGLKLSDSKSDEYMYQLVRVEPNTMYEISDYSKGDTTYGHKVLAYSEDGSEMLVKGYVWSERNQTWAKKETWFDTGDNEVIRIAVVNCEGGEHYVDEVSLKKTRNIPNMIDNIAKNATDIKPWSVKKQAVDIDDPWLLNKNTELTRPAFSLSQFAEEGKPNSIRLVRAGEGDVMSQKFEVNQDAKLGLSFKYKYPHAGTHIYVCDVDGNTIKDLGTLSGDEGVSTNGGQAEVYLNGKPIAEKPIYIDGRMYLSGETLSENLGVEVGAGYVPLRENCERLGFNVEWSDAYNAAFVDKCDEWHTFSARFESGELADLMLKIVDDTAGGVQYFSDFKVYEYIDVVEEEKIDPTTNRRVHFIRKDGWHIIHNYVSTADWTNDGKRFVFNYVKDKGGDMKFTTDEEADTRVAVYDTETKEAIFIGWENDNYNGTVADNKFFYRPTPENGWAIVIIDLNTLERRLGMSHGMTTPLSVTPDGRYGATRFKTGSPEIEFIDFEKHETRGNGVINLGVVGNLLHHVVINPKNPHVALFVKEDLQADDFFWFADLDKGEYRCAYKQQTNDDGTNGEYVGHPVWSADGKSLIGIKYRQSKIGSVGIIEIPFETDKEGGEMKLIVEGEYEHVGVCPTGRYLAADRAFDYTKGIKAPTGIDLIDLEEGTVESLCAFNLGEAGVSGNIHPHPTWSYDGTKVTFSSQYLDNGQMCFTWIDITEPLGESDDGIADGAAEVEK